MAIPLKRPGGVKRKNPLVELRFDAHAWGFVSLPFARDWAERLLTDGANSAIERAELTELLLELRRLKPLEVRKLDTPDTPLSYRIPDWQTALDAADERLAANEAEKLKAGGAEEYLRRAS